MRRKRLNVMRRQGRLFFERVSSRYDDGTRDGDEILWIYSSRSKPRIAVPVRVFVWPITGKREVSFLLGTDRIAAPIAAARMIREHINACRAP